MSKLYSINQKAKRAMTPEIIGSFVHILEPGRNMNDTADVWGMQIRMKKDAPGVAEFVKELPKLYGQALVDKFGADKAKAMSKVYTVPLRDGDADEEADKELEGYWFFSANNYNGAPTIVGPAGKAVDPDTLTTDDIYSGAKFRCLIEFYTPKDTKNKRVCCSLVGVMKTGDGERLDGQITQDQAAAEFSDFAADAADLMAGAGETMDGDIVDGGDTQQGDIDADDFDFG